MTPRFLVCRMENYSTREKFSGVYHELEPPMKSSLFDKRVFHYTRCGISASPGDRKFEERPLDKRLCKNCKRCAEAAQKSS